jgi:hypothetical protein
MSNQSNCCDGNIRILLGQGRYAIHEASIVEEALQKSSGVRILIKFFGCDSLPKLTENIDELREANVVVDHLASNR